MELEQELAFFNAHRQKYLEHYRDQFALIKSGKLIGTYTTWEEAFASGVEQLGNVPFLIKPVQEEDEVVQFPALVVGAISADS